MGEWKRKKSETRKTQERTDSLIKCAAVTWKLRSRGVIADHFAIDANVQIHFCIFSSQMRVEMDLRTRTWLSAMRTL